MSLSSLTDDDLPEERTSTGARNRRISVSAETMGADELNSEKVVHPKTDEQKARITNAIKGNFLFGRLEPALHAELIDAMVERPVKNGEELIKQVRRGSDAGDTGSVEADRRPAQALPVLRVLRAPRATTFTWSSRVPLTSLWPSPAASPSRSPATRRAPPLASSRSCTTHHGTAPAPMCAARRRRPPLTRRPAGCGGSRLPRGFGR